MFLSHAVMTEGAAPSFERPIDLVHLARQTLGDRALEREILGLFVVQARAIYDQIAQTTEMRRRADLAHTLKGSARAVGAWQVANAAEACESLAEAGPAGWKDALAALSGAIGDAIDAIGALGAFGRAA